MTYVRTEKLGTRYKFIHGRTCDICNKYFESVKGNKKSITTQNNWCSLTCRKTYFEQTKWLERCPEKWERCRKCYDFRLKRTLEEAKKLDISNYTTTLTISPHKDENKIFETWIILNKTNKEQFLFLDFKKRI